jgi:hypothetical protein
MCLKRIRNYFDELGKRDKIQTREMEKAIERSRYITEARLQGGKAIGEIVKPKDKKSKKNKHNS